MKTDWISLLFCLEEMEFLCVFGFNHTFSCCLEFRLPLPWASRKYPPGRRLPCPEWRLSAGPAGPSEV